MRCCHLLDCDFLVLGAIYSAVTLQRAFVRLYIPRLREGDHLEDPGVDGRIILKWIFERLGVGAQTGLIWLRTGTGGGLLCIRWWTFGFHKMRGISWVAEDILASQEGLCSMELVYSSSVWTSKIVRLLVCPWAVTGCHGTPAFYMIKLPCLGTWQKGHSLPARLLPNVIKMHVH
jgi:hypothetical protein